MFNLNTPLYNEFKKELKESFLNKDTFPRYNYEATHPQIFALSDQIYKEPSKK